MEVCTNPRFRENKGKTGVLNAENILTVVRLYPMYDLYIALVDRDGDPNRQAELDGLEQAVRAQLAPGQTFIAEDAHQEVEVWVLTGYLPSARQRGVLASVGGGRKVLMEEALSEWARLLGRWAAWEVDVPLTASGLDSGHLG